MTSRRRDAPRAATAHRYLLASERLQFAVRRHPAVLVGAACRYLALLLLAGVLLGFAGGSGLVLGAGALVLIGSTGWFGWRLGDWWVERFTVTDRRVLLVSGLLTRRVAIMPLRKVTDLTFERTLAGRLLGYGAFVMESAGQAQALSRVDFLPQPDSLYLQMSDLLFGRGDADRDPDEDGDDRRGGRSRVAQRARGAGRGAGPARGPATDTTRVPVHPVPGSSEPEWSVPGSSTPGWSVPGSSVPRPPRSGPPAHATARLPVVPLPPGGGRRPRGHTPWSEPPPPPRSG